MTDQEKFYGIYKENLNRYGRDWAKKVPSYEERKKGTPFATVTMKANSAMRRYLGAEKFGLYAQVLEHLATRDGLLTRDQNHQLDVTFAAFVLWHDA